MSIQKAPPGRSASDRLAGLLSRLSKIVLELRDQRRDFVT
jgi:hypothetical protein